MTTLNISLPDAMREFIQSQVNDAGYSTASEYIRELVRADEKRKRHEQINRNLLAALESGESSPWTEQDKQQLLEIAKGLTQP